MSDLERAKALLAQDPSLTCAFVRGGETVTSSERGVKPLLSWAEAGKTLEGFSAADRVVGRAAALLYVFLNVKEVFAFVLSEPAEEAFQTHKTAYGYQKRTKGIVNRAGTGPCPMEQATEGITDPAEALKAIRRKWKELAER